MANKNMNTRIRLKNDTEAHWGLASAFAPLEGEAIVYSADLSYAFPRLKIGDGSTLVGNLPFANDQADWSVTDTTKASYIKNKPTIATAVNNDATIPTGAAVRTYVGNNNGVQTIASGTSNGTIAVTTNGSTANVAVKGLGTAAYTASTAYATAAQGAKADNAMPKSGGAFTGVVTMAADPTLNLEVATKQYVDNNVSVSNTLGNGTQIGTITVNGVEYNMYTPNEAPMTVAVTQSSSTPTAEFVVGTNTEASASLTGILSDTTTIANGKIVYYLTRYELPSSEVTLTLQYANSGTDTGAIPIYSFGDQRCVTPYPAYYLLTLVYYDSKFYIASAALGVVK